MATTPASSVLQPHFRLSLTPEDLRERFAPRFRFDYKRRIVDECCPDGCQSGGEVHVSRWPTLGVVDVSEGVETEAVAVPGAYRYASPEHGRLEWHTNFAAADLFYIYDGRAFAQDEIQVFEHPALGGVREALLSLGHSTWVTDDGMPTPFLVRGVERRLTIDTTARDDDPRWSSGLYGRKFSSAPFEVAREAVTRIEPPTVSNILAIEAPCLGAGAYTAEEIDFALHAAFTGFRVATLEARSLGLEATVHTGFWGCGAYGGHPVLMTAVQLIAARLAGLPRVEFYLWDEWGADRFAMGERVARAVLEVEKDRGSEGIVERLVEMRFEWGFGDGN